MVFFSVLLCFSICCFDDFTITEKNPNFLHHSQLNSVKRGNAIFTAIVNSILNNKRNLRKKRSSKSWCFILNFLGSMIFFKKNAQISNKERFHFLSKFGSKWRAFSIDRMCFSLLGSTWPKNFGTSFHFGDYIIAYHYWQFI